MNKTLHFLSGIPRSGSTVLAAILNQNPETHVSTTSGLVHALDGLANTWHSAGLLNENDPKRTKLAQTMRGMIDAFYEDTDKAVIIDKSRGWPIPQIMAAMTQVLDRPCKVIATVRPVPDCMASFVRVAKPDDLDDFIYSGQLADHLKAAYQSLQSGFEYDPSSMLFVEYDNLIGDPEGQLARVHDFLGLAPFDYDFNAIDGSTVSEDDENLHGYAGMHDVKTKLEKQHNDSSKEVLRHHYNQFCQPEFWNDNARTMPELDDLDLQCASGKIGDFVEGWRLSEKLNTDRPTDHRAAYNRSWYLLRQGDIANGYKEMDRGRYCGIIGSKRPDTPMPEWDGKAKGTILLYCDHGLGDQIHQVRYAKDLVARGNKVVVCCTGMLAQLFSTIEGVSAVIQHGAEFGIFHDFWTYAMVVPYPLGYTLADISGKPYIDVPTVIKGNKKRIGLRWQGCTKYEEDHNKKFPHELMFHAVKGASTEYEFISLQKDEGAGDAPAWVKTVPLDSWSDTQRAVASCDLVISSCTSVSHLSAAMGIPTWVVLPIMGYYLYALDGEKTPYYDSMTLFRQELFGDWQAPFDAIKKRLGDKRCQQNILRE
jgi:hypothetical protein